MIEQGIWRYLADDPTVSGIVSTRIYRDTILPKGYSLPAINFFEVETEPIESLSGESPTDTKRYQFSCRASTQDVANNLRDAVRSLLVPKSDGSGATTTVNYTLPNGTYIQAARTHAARALPSEEGPGESIRHSMVEVEFTYENS
jgi:hypothetical protein